MVEVLDEKAAEKYLGRKLCFEDGQETEFKNRFAAAWAAFHRHKGELCNKFYCLRDRVKLFDAVVSPVVLYACSTWTLTKRMETKLQVERRRVLRYVFRIFRRRAPNEEEEWV